MTRFALPALVLLAACAPAHPSGPGVTDLQRLIAEARPGAAPQVRDVRCRFIGEEGSEWRCHYRERASNGRWISLETFVAATGDGWVLIDGVADPDRPPAF